MSEKKSNVERCEIRIEDLIECDSDYPLTWKMIKPYIDEIKESVRKHQHNKTFKRVRDIVKPYIKDYSLYGLKDKLKKLEAEHESCR